VLVVTDTATTVTDMVTAIRVPDMVIEVTEQVEKRS